MLFLILLCSTLPYILATGWSDKNFEDTVDQLIGSCEDLGLPKYIGESLGVDASRTYKLTGYKYSMKIAEIFNSTDDHKTLREQLELAKRNFPELKDDIDLYAVVESKELYVFYMAVKYQLVIKGTCIFTNVCELTDVSVKDALELLDYYGETIYEMLTNFGNQTAKRVGLIGTLLHDSKLLNMNEWSVDVKEKYKKWFNTCVGSNLSD